MAATKRKRVSKKNKKSWRKNVNIDDVEDFLEDKRLEERTGCNVSEIRNEDLFEIYTIGDNENTYTRSKIPKVKHVSSSFRLTEKDTPKSFAILEKRSAVKDPIIKRNRIKTREEKRHPAVKKILQERAEKGILTAKIHIKQQKELAKKIECSHTTIKKHLHLMEKVHRFCMLEMAKQKQSLRDKKRVEELRKKKSKIPEFKYELWSKENENNLNSEWLRSDTVRHTLTNTGHLQVKPPKSITAKTSLLPAVETPHPGLSYNPSLKDYQEVLTKVAEVEKEMVKEEKHIKRVTTDMFSKVKQAEADKEWYTEMLVGFEENENDDDEEITGDYTTVNPPVKNKKKTLQKRRRLREAAKLKAQIKQKKIEKKKISDIYKLRNFNASFKKEDFAQRKAKEKREKLKKLKPYQTKQLSHVKFEEPLLEYNPIENMSGNLRGLITDCNLLMDRYKSLQKRNILEPAVKHFPKKIKKKKYERESTKVGWEPKGF